MNALTFTSGILTDTALSVRQIPLDIQDADFTPQDPATPVERQTGGTQDTPAELADFFSFDRGERKCYRLYRRMYVQEFLDALGDDASAEDRIAAYTALADAEQALYNQQVSFITNATDITDEARGGL